MANITSWILKSKQNGLELGETIQAALGVTIKNKAKNMAAGYMLGGGVGTLVAAEKLKREEKQELNQSVLSIEQYPHGAVIIALTESRLLVYRLNWLGRPKALGASYPRANIAKAEMVNTKPNNNLTLTFMDGGTVTHDVSLAQGQELKKFVDLVNDTQTQVRK
jgi:hypothetical protein